MERVYKNTDEITDNVKAKLVLGGRSGWRLDIYLDGRKVGYLDKHNKEVGVKVQVAANGDVKLASAEGTPEQTCVDVPVPKFLMKPSPWNREKKLPGIKFNMKKCCVDPGNNPPIRCEDIKEEKSTDGATATKG